MSRLSIRDPRVQAAIAKRHRKKCEQCNREKVLKALADGAWHGWRALLEATELPGAELGKALDQLRVLNQIEFEDGLWKRTE